MSFLQWMIRPSLMTSCNMNNWPNRPSKRGSPPLLRDTAHPGPPSIIVSDPILLTWLSDASIWVDQWPITEPKLSSLKELIKEQLILGHLEPLNSRHNTLIFVIKKKSGKYRLQEDLRAINEQMEEMRMTQEGLPCSGAFPPSYHRLVMEIKDCLFQIP